MSFAHLEEPAPGALLLSEIREQPAAFERLLEHSAEYAAVAALVPDLTAADLERGSFYELLRERYGVSIDGGVQTIEPTVTNEEESSALGVPLHSPAFMFERFSRDENGATVEFVRSIYRGDRYRLVTELSRRDRAGAVPVFVLRDAG